MRVEGGLLGRVRSLALVMELLLLLLELLLLTLERHGIAWGRGRWQARMGLKGRICGWIVGIHYYFSFRSNLILAQV
jgi:hypothetical protein